MTSEHDHRDEVPDSLPERFGDEEPMDSESCDACAWEAMHYGTRGREPFAACVLCQTTDHVSLSMHLHLSVEAIEHELKEGRLRGTWIHDTWLIHSDAIRAWLNAPPQPGRGLS